MELRQDGEKQEPWYESWFDSQYYNLLYSDRDEEEAENFLQRLMAKLNPPAGARMLDLACGKGRYSRFLAQMGYQVVGLDLSANSIASARKYENAHLSFFQHDMRALFRVNYFDYIFNFFTSFGYFEREEDNLAVLENVYKGLKAGGTFVIDYLNATFVKENLVPHNSKVVKGIRFDLHRYVDGEFVVKKISFTADGRDWEFMESVRLFSNEELGQMLESVGFRIKNLYGNYQLDPYNEHSSERMIMVAEKDKYGGDDYWMGRTDISLD